MIHRETVYDSLVMTDMGAYLSCAIALEEERCEARC
jgi:hypothetical protein